jgi:hypothetical protein
MYCTSEQGFVQAFDPFRVRSRFWAGWYPSAVPEARGQASDRKLRTDPPYVPAGDRLPAPFESTAPGV